MDRYYTPPSSPSSSANPQISTPSPRRSLQQSPRRKSNTSDTVIENWTTLATKIDDLVTIEEIQEELNENIVNTLRTELLKELDRTAWMYNDHSYA